jgi:hypothetical protein
MAKIQGFLASLQISRNGVDFHDVPNLLNANVTKEGNTEDDTVMQDRGMTKDYVQSITIGLSAEGQFDPTSEALAILQDLFYSKQKVYVRFYRHYQQLLTFESGVASISNFEAGHEVEGRATYTLELGFDASTYIYQRG